MVAQVDDTVVADDEGVTVEAKVLVQVVDVEQRPVGTAGIPQEDRGVEDHLSKAPASRVHRKAVGQAEVIVEEPVEGSAPARPA